MQLDLTDYQRGILTGVLVSASNEADRAGRSGPWVEGVLAILTAINRAENLAKWQVQPIGGEPFGTQVTYWSESWGTRHAVITRSPKPADKRDRFDLVMWQIVIKENGMTHAPAGQLTLGWHPDHFTEETFN